MESKLAGLTQNEYEGLEITADILARNLIMPGMAFRVHITIKNSGNETISYVQGSGSSTTPQALYITANGLQPVVPEDNLGVQTMDYRTNLLKPGEELKFVATIMAIVPNENFEGNTHGLYMKTQTYIATLSWEELHEAYPELEIAAPGTYTVDVYFIYAIVAKASENQSVKEATSYQTTQVAVSISG